MESSIKKGSFEEAVRSRLPLTTDSAFLILSTADVGDAMNFSIASAGDSDYSEIYELMKDDYIWNYWTKRDMDVIYDKKWNSSTTLWPVKDSPKWKVYYLWFRIFVSLQQNIRIGDLEEYDEFDDLLEYLSFNLFQITKKSDDSVIVLDSRKHLADIYNKYSREGAFDPPSYVTKTYKDLIMTKIDNKAYYYLFHNDVDEQHSFTEFYMHYFKDKSDVGITVFHQIIFAIYKFLKEGKLSPALPDLFPRLFPIGSNKQKKKHIILAKCIECGQDGKKYERGNPAMIFCDINCQKEFRRK